MSHNLKMIYLLVSNRRPQKWSQKLISSAQKIIKACQLHHYASNVNWSESDKNKFYLENKNLLLIGDYCTQMFVITSSCVYMQRIFYEVITICDDGTFCRVDIFLSLSLFFLTPRTHSELSWLHQILIYESAYRFSLLKTFYLISIRKAIDESAKQ